MTSDLFRHFSKVYAKVSKGSALEYKLEQKRFIKKMADVHSMAKRLKLLDAACGDGLLLSVLKNDYDVTGFDADKDKIKRAKMEIKGVRFFMDNLIKPKLKGKFDIITCFDAIDHVDAPKKNLGKVLKNLHSLLNDKGLLVFDLQMAKDGWVNGNVHSELIEAGKDEKLIWLTHKSMEGKTYRFDKVVISLNGRKLKQEFKTDVFSFRPDLLTIGQVKDLAEEAGFSVKVYEDYDGKKWDKGSKHTPKLVCIKP